MQATEPLAHALIDLLVIKLGTFPAHTTDEANRLQCEILSTTRMISPGRADV